MFGVAGDGGDLVVDGKKESSDSDKGGSEREQWTEKEMRLGAPKH